jgi:hypothetical protein
MGSELCITVTSSPPRAPLHEAMRFAVARYAEAASQFSTLQAAVSLAAQSIISHVTIDVSQACVVGEIVARFQEYAHWCSHLKATGLGGGALRSCSWTSGR